MPDRQLPSRHGHYHGWPLERSRRHQSLGTCQLQWKAGTRRWRERRRTGLTVQKTTRLRMARLWSPPVGERCSFCAAPRPAECHPPEPLRTNIKSQKSISLPQGSPVAHNKKKIPHEQGHAVMLLDHCGSQKQPMTKSGGQGFG